MPSASFLGTAGSFWPRVQGGHQASTSGRTLQRPVTQAFAKSYAESYRRGGGVTYERVLRYPDGRERRIRYPVPTEDPNASLDAGEERATSTTWEASRAGATADRRHVDAPVRPAPAPSAPPHPDDEIPNSPLALLRYMTSDAHRDAQRREMEQVRGSYEILQGCPWPAPKPLYVLAVSQPGAEAGLTHTLRTRLPRADLEDEITRLLGGRTRDSGEPLIRCGEITDGVVTFESDEDAEAYGRALEEGGAMGVTVARCDSHELFRNVQSVQGVVVLLRRGGVVPPVHKLSAALRGHNPLDDKAAGG